jgi:hypothetical protein
MYKCAGTWERYNMNKYLKLQFGNSCDLEGYYLKDGFTFTTYLEGEVYESEEDKYEEGEDDSNGDFIPTFKRGLKRYIVRLGLMNLATVEMLHSLRVFDTFTLTMQTGEVMPIFRPEFTHEWQFAELQYATGELKFDMGEINKKLYCCEYEVVPPS